MRSRRTPTLAQPRRRSRATAGLALATLAPTLAAGLTVGVGLATAPAAYAAPANCTTVGLRATCTFGFIGGDGGGGHPQDWTVPAGVDRATLTVVGASGQSSATQPGGRGGGTVATIATTPGQVLQLRVGGVYVGDASDVRVAPYGRWDRILVGGGGGAAGDAPSGRVSGAGGNGGGANVPASPGTGVSAAGGGGAGGATAGGFGGASQSPSADCGIIPADDGSSYQGGRGGSLYGVGPSCPWRIGLSGGRGGGGWYGGGGGGVRVDGAAGGGGGSGYGPAGSTSTPLGEPGANGKITISYVDPSSGWVDFSEGGQMTSAPTAVMRPAGAWQPEPTQDVFYLDDSNQVIQRVVTNGVPSPEYNLGHVLYPGSTVAAVWRTGGRLDLFGRGTENALWQKAYSAQTGWGAWIRRTHPASSPPAPPSSHRWWAGWTCSSAAPTTCSCRPPPPWAPGPHPRPSAAADPPSTPHPPPWSPTLPQGRVNIYAGCNGALCSWRYANDGGDVYFWGRIPGVSVTAAPTAASPGPGRVQVSVRDNAGNLILWQTNAAGYYPTNLGPAPPAAGSSIGVAPMSATTSVLYARGSQGTLVGRSIAP